jgi:ADP-ribose pyrophosphatase YjhB (NUDIX family)
VNNIHCTRCGTPLVETWVAEEGRNRLVCPGCGHIHYINPKIVSGTLPLEHGGVWLLRRGIEPRLGFWSHPAGFQEHDESTEEAAVRETLEEIGCDVVIDRLFGVYSRPGGPVVNIVYLAHFATPHTVPCTSPEALEVRRFGPRDIPWDELAFPSTARILSDWARQAGSHED